MCYRQSFHHNPWKQGMHAHWKGHGKHHPFGGGMSRFGFPPVNVQELDDRYEVLVFVPGYEKSDFKLGIRDHLLVLSVSAKEESTEFGRWRRKEYKVRSFERSFELPDQVDKEKITATYADGVLQITLSKLEGKETFRQDIEIV